MATGTDDPRIGRQRGYLFSRKEFFRPFLVYSRVYSDSIREESRAIEIFLERKLEPLVGQRVRHELERPGA